MNPNLSFPIEFPILESADLLLKMPELSDAQDFHELLTNPNVTRFYDWETYQHIDESIALINKLRQSFLDKNGIRWTIVLKDSREVIGFVGCFQIQLGFTAGIGYGVKEKYWNKGLMQQALNQVIAYSISVLELNRIYAEVMPGNIGSEKVLSKVGFKKEGLLRESKYFKGKFHDMILFSLIKGDIIGIALPQILGYQSIEN